ncbi:MULTISPECIES: response regulator transcription factor [Chryseobacterium]|jgi:CheY-like chemotaxis protein|uniref:Response regulator transcription factor n=1 Tax=Chryseobacterium nepalense TaxID=1854498 RepID=A0ABY4K657_9FLAO|nr:MULTISPECIES: response regulator transcription factor [Chryseobacterium]MEA1848628.1 response regulator transcription factor [Chryseobacterium sp. MHB01]MEC5174762.1 CheY-like chemotaxis protein [Chryseobacterium nepalense]UPQ76280.1 response regulator transcription factor [Chryseobacterium nepalense]
MNSKKIMVCDDDQGILDVLEMLLESEGFTVFTEINSTNLIKQIQIDKPDLILLDLWMPLLSGDQVLKAIRNTQDIKDLPVIVLSASVDGDDIAADAGANDFVAKPFDLDHIVSKINGLLVLK